MQRIWTPLGTLESALRSACIGCNDMRGIAQHAAAITNPVKLLTASVQYQPANNVIKSGEKQQVLGVLYKNATVSDKPACWQQQHVPVQRCWVSNHSPTGYHTSLELTQATIATTAATVYSNGHIKYY